MNRRIRSAAISFVLVALTGFLAAEAGPDLATTALLVVGHEKSRLPNFRRVGTYVWSNTNASNTGWGWQGEERTIAACDATTGKVRWTQPTGGPVRLAPAVAGGRVFVGKGLSIPFDPMIGVIGTAPEYEGVPTTTPGTWISWSCRPTRCTRPMARGR